MWISSDGAGTVNGPNAGPRVLDEKHVPILYIDMDLYLPKLKLDPAARSRVLYGAHQIAGRLEDMPLKSDYGAAESRALGPVPENKGLAALGKLGFSGSLTLGSWIPDVMAHGGGRRNSRQRG